jgi:hypothetical protein
VRYLALSYPNLEVVDINSDRLQTFVPPPSHEQTWCIEFTGSEAHQRIKRLLAEYELRCPEHVIFDSGGKPLLSVVGPLFRMTGSGPIASTSN